MSAPYTGYAEREATSCEGCGGPVDDCSCMFAGEDMLECGGPDFLWCESCKRTTTHLEYSDEHGSNRMLACTGCRRVARFY